VASAHQLTSDNDGGLDIAATSIACQHKFHRGFWPFSRRALGSVMGIDHYA
jgi:hypothetical protein